LLCALDISRNGKLGKKKRSRELRGRWLLPAVLSVDKGDGSAQCSPAKPNTSPAGVSSNLASCPAVLVFFTLALLLVIVLVYLQQLRHFPTLLSPTCFSPTPSVCSPLTSSADIIYKIADFDTASKPADSDSHLINFLMIQS